MIEQLVFEYILEILVIVLSAYSGIMWRLNKRLKDKADRERLNNIENKLDSINSALFGNEDYDTTGKVEDNKTEIERLHDEVEENNKRIDLVLYILSKEIDSEHQDQVNELLGINASDLDYDPTD